MKVFNFDMHHDVVKKNNEIDKLRNEICKLLGKDLEAEIYEDIKMYSYSLALNNSTTIISFLKLKLNQINSWKSITP
ncbi:hypothetical protein [Chryseobacterium sp. JV274]|uniref:hypothetical protein n=1 Tax=Chryseobacterium sp. JV274 TaxID=1932669 RepID=UPI0015C229C5|nr:hypothetical protein [Chryseobacterium sp. JV274]CAD0220354.1 protein of unknown function [Chryseobacterium sp. JV274]